MKLRKQLGLFSLGLMLVFSFAFTSCGNVTTNEYQATALTKLTWNVKYTPKYQGQSERERRFEEFTSASLLNTNGQRPDGILTQPDDQGLWWPKVPPKPSLDDIEQRAKSQEEHHRPELFRQVNYEMTYKDGGNSVTLSTNYSVYRQVVKAAPQQKTLKLTLGVRNRSVAQVEVIGD